MAILKARETSSDTFKPVATMGVGNASQSQRGLMTAQDKVKLDNMYNYSTGEQVIGTWIDGKPIYRKYITISPSATLTKDSWSIICDVSSLNIDSVINYRFWRNNKTQILNGFETNISNGNVVIWDAYNDSGIYAMLIEYTKKSD